jgi:V/A-type H+-transporting ATPase subunit A
VLIKEAILQQSALDPNDSYCSPEKQFGLLDTVLHFHDGGMELIGVGVPFEQLDDLPFATQLKRLKSILSNDDMKPLKDLHEEIGKAFEDLRLEYERGREETP